MAAGGAVELFRLLGTIAVNRGEAIGDIKAVEAQAAKTAAGIARSVDKASRSFQRIGTALTIGVTAPMLAMGAAAVKASVDFNAGMSNVASLIPGNTKRVGELKRGIQDLAVAVGKTTGDLTGGLYQVISAFGDSSDSLAILDVNARAATAGVSTTTDAINLTSAVTKGYGDTTKEAVQRAADLALMTVRLGQTTFPELAASIGYVTPLAASLKISQEELFAVMATGTGVTGSASQVATQFRGVLQSLLAPTKDMTALLEAKGYASGEAMLADLGLAGALKLISDTATASHKPLQAYISSIEGQTLALALAGPQADTLRQKLGQMQEAAGATDAAFKEQTEGVNKAGFALSQLRAKVEVTAQRFGDGLAPALSEALDAGKPLLDWITKLAQQFAELDPKTQRAIVTALALAAAVGPVNVVFGKSLGVLKNVIPWLGKLPAAIRAAGGMLQWMAGAGVAGAWVVAIAAIGAMAVSVTNDLIEMKRQMQGTAAGPVGARLQTRRELADTEERIAGIQDTIAHVQNAWLPQARKDVLVNKLEADIDRLQRRADQLRAQIAADDAKAKQDLARRQAGAAGGGGGGGTGGGEGGGGGGDAGGKSATRLEASEAYRRSLQVDIALAEQGSAARIAAEQRYWDWRDAAITKYRDSSLLAERSLAADLKQERDKDLADRKAELEQREQDLTESQRQNLEALQGQDETDRQYEDQLWERRRQAAKQALEERIQLEQDWLQYRLDAGQVDLDAYLARLQQEVAATRGGTREQLDLLKQIDDAKERIFQRDQRRSQEAEAAIGEQLRRLHDSGEWQLMSLEQQAWWLQRAIGYYEQQGIAVDNVRRELEWVNAEIALGAVTLQNVWLGAVRDMGSAFSSFFEGLMEGTRGFGDLMQGVLSAIRHSLADLLAQSVMQPLQGAMARWLGLNVPGAVGSQQGLVLQASPELSKGFSAFAGAAAMLPGPLGAMVGVATQWVLSATVGKANASVALLAASVQKASASVNLGAAMQSTAAGGLMATAGGVMAAAAAAMMTAAATMAAAAASIGLFGFLGFQEGGVVTHPTLAMVAEKEPEVIIPFSKLLAGRASFSPSPAALPAGKLPAGLAAAGATVNVMPGAMPMNLNADSLDSLQLDRLAARLTPRIAAALWNAWRLVPVGRA